MARLLDAVPQRARLILLGDKNQLASVEAGAVLGDICGVGAEPAQPIDSPLSASVVQLDRSYRYAEHSGIRQLADAINRSDADAALELLADPALADLRWVDTSEEGSLEQSLLPSALEQFAAFFEAREPLARLEALDRFRVLCAHRRGPFGQVNLNARIEAEATRAGLIAPKFGRYAGRPVLITQNDPRAQLFNGDVGVLLESAERDRALRAFFRAPQGAVRSLGLSRLPPHESVYAMSVHKSQGSEFDSVAVVLPQEPSPVLSRELLYTAVTRARHSVTIYASASIVKLAIERAVQRASGLRDKLWT
jgi:exodeoxyribonuclease V alpha subunit